MGNKSKYKNINMTTEFESSFIRKMTKIIFPKKTGIFLSDSEKH